MADAVDFIVIRMNISGENALPEDLSAVYGETKLLPIYTTETELFYSLSTDTMESKKEVSVFH